MTGPEVPLAGWRPYAACLHLPVDVWFTSPGEDVTILRKVCGACPVRILCLEDAMTAERVPSDTHGMRGGLTAYERNKLRRQRATAAQDKAVA